MESNLSYWETNTWLKNNDTIIIGCGLVGLSAAYYLKKNNPKSNILILERGILPDGASTKNAGFACFGSISELLSDIKTSSETQVLALLEQRYNGLLNLRALLGDKNLGFEAYGGYEVFKKGHNKEAIDAISYFNNALYKISKKKNVYSIADNKINGFGLKGFDHLIYNKLEGQLNTGQMMLTLLQKVQTLGVKILFKTEVKQIKGLKNGASLVLKNDFELSANKILITTNGFTKQLLKEVDVKPARAQVLITSPIKGLKLKGTFHYDEGFYYFRNIGERVLLGGGRNLNVEGETTIKAGTTRQIQDKLENLLKENILPKHTFTIEQRWSGIMGMGQNKTPLIKEIQPNIFCAVRFGGMGIALGTMAGKNVADLILKGASKSEML